VYHPATDPGARLRGDGLTRRRLLLALIALAACVEPLGLSNGADAQQPAAPRRIGVLLVGFSPEGSAAQAFREGLRNAGYTEGRDMIIEWRSANGDYDRVPELVAELVQGKVDVIVADSTVAAQSLKRATSTIPIVMAMVSDPVGFGLVTNLARPGGNITGLSLMNIELSAKRLQLLKEVFPKLTRVAVLSTPAPADAKAVQELSAPARSLAIRLTHVSVSRPEEIGPAFSVISRAHAQALFVAGGPMLTGQLSLPLLVELMSKARLPAISYSRAFAEAGGLISYGTNVDDNFRRSAGYVDKILKGAKPGDLPIEQPTKFELVVNLKTARALGITIPESILLRADEVIR